MPHRQGYPSPSTVDSSDHEICQPSPISSFDSHDTPKENGINASPVRRALEAVRARARGGPVRACAKADGIEFAEITPSQYLHARPQFERVRHDYDPLRHILFLRMPTSVHDVFGNRLLNKITAWVEGLRAERLPRVVQEVVSNIEPAATSDFEIPVPEDPEAPPRPEKASFKHSPDGQFHYIGSRYPPFVVEIGYSQRQADLPALARHYFEDTDGFIKTVLTIDLEYTPKVKRKARGREQNARRQTRSQSRQGKTSAASFSFYRGPKRVVSDQLFRDQAGNHVQSEGLALRLSDMVPDAVSKGLQPDPTLHISSSELFNMLARSELVQKDRDKTRTPSPPPQPTRRRQKRKVEWALEEDEVDEEKPSDEQDRPAGKRPRSASSSSKRRRLSDTGFSSSSRPAALPLMQTRSRSRGRQESHAG